MLQACILDFGGNWDAHIRLTEFAYNNNNQSSIGITPCEAFYSRPCRSPMCWEQVWDQKLYGPELIEEINFKIALIKSNLQITQN